MKPSISLQEYLKVADQFHLGKLDTESSNELTSGLAETSLMNPPEAVKKFVSVDRKMLDTFLEKASEIEELSEVIKDTFQKGHRVYLCGCGATGRLSLTLETLWRQLTIGTPREDWVRSFMAGGDVALISSIEKFEDYPHYGSRQLVESGFEKGDLLIASSEGGETPWVIGACEKASEYEGVIPYFLYCNPDAELNEACERSRNILSNSKIKKINLSHGPQALSGSTRLQASSILEGAIGFSLFESDINMSERIRYYRDWYLNLDHQKVIPFFIRESELYQKGEFLSYFPAPELGISVLTDTTERSPTFSLHPFENLYETGPTSLCNLVFLSETKALDAWRRLLCRDPRPLEWNETKELSGGARLKGFDFSSNGLKAREQKLQSPQKAFNIMIKGDQLLWELEELQAFFPLPKGGALEMHLLLKMLLNMHSTLLMGRLGRYESNVMTWVRPSNNKLIDRAIRYADHLLQRRGKKFSYETLATVCFRVMETMKSDESLVLSVVQELCLDS